MPTVTFLGHSAFIVKCSKATLAIDPFISGNPSATVAAKEIKADYVLLTHGHPDHFGDGIEIAKNNNATVIAPFELATYCGEKGCTVHPMHIGGAHDFPFGRVKLTIAVHGSGFPGPLGMLYMGNPCGFLVTADGKTIYHAGDTGLFYDMKLIGEMNRIDAALLPIGGNFTMDIDDAAKAVELLRPGLVIPMHYNTFDLIAVKPERFLELAEKKGSKGKILRVGESLEV